MSSNSLTIGWLYFDLMNTYGDRGNVMILKHRAAARGINATVSLITLGSSADEIAKCDLLFMGGAQDRQQSMVQQDLERKKKQLVNAIHDGIPGVYVCGAYQLLGNYYLTPEGERIEGLGILDLYTQAASSKERLVGNIIVKAAIGDIEDSIIIGFENHGGKTYLGAEMTAFGTVTRGFGNNGKDKTEGVLYKNTIGTYLHGPLFAKNPNLADWVIAKALEKKYGQPTELKKMDDKFEQQAREKFLKQYS